MFFLGFLFLLCYIGVEVISMLYNAKNGTLPIDGTTMDYVRFGTGMAVLIMLPGLGDGLRTVKGTALPMALLYRRFARDFTVYMFSRKNDLPQGASTQDMARDLKHAMELLGIPKAHIFGVSMGGMIAQHFAAGYPEAVEKLVLTVTCPRPNPTLLSSVSEWKELALRRDHAALMDSNLRLIYSDNYYRKNKWMIPLVGKLTRPASYSRFLIQADACLTHNAYDRLPQIQAPTLVIGGEKDLALGGDASREIAAQIPHARLHMYHAWGHGLYEEAKDFNDLVLSFLKS